MADWKGVDLASAIEQAFGTPGEDERPAAAGDENEG